MFITVKENLYIFQFFTISLFHLSLILPFFHFIFRSHSVVPGYQWQRLFTHCARNECLSQTYLMDNDVTCTQKREICRHRKHCFSSIQMDTTKQKNITHVFTQIKAIKIYEWMTFHLWLYEICQWNFICFFDHFFFFFYSWSGLWVCNLKMDFN